MKNAKTDFNDKKVYLSPRLSSCEIELEQSIAASSVTVSPGGGTNDTP